jgi:adenylate kinase family enzyme
MTGTSRKTDAACERLQPGERICVVGTSGSGKTYVARVLARTLGLAYICNDALIWGPNWTPVPREQVYAAQEAAMRAPRWAFDGNLTLSRPEDLMALERCDTVVWLDLPRRQVHWQVLRRTLARVLVRQPLWHGNRESWRTLLSPDSIVWWSIKTYARRRREYAAVFADPRWAAKLRIRLRTRHEVDSWLASLPVAVEGVREAPP